MEWKQLNNELGNIDLYWLDFILKGYLPENAKVLDAGCGEGRNLTYCMKNQMDVFGIDQNPEAISFLKLLARQYKVENIDARFQVMKLNKVLFPDATFDSIICSAVLHFANDVAHFEAMITELARLLKSGGKLFIRTMTDRLIPNDDARFDASVFQFHNGEKRFIINADAFINQIESLQLTLIEPYKEVVVQNRHTMGTFMLEKY